MATLYAAYVAALRSMHAPGAATYMQDQPTLQYQPQYPPQQPASYATYQPPPSHPVGGYEDHHRGIPAMEPVPPVGSRMVIQVGHESTSTSSNNRLVLTIQ